LFNALGAGALPTPLHRSGSGTPAVLVHDIAKLLRLRPNRYVRVNEFADKMPADWAPLDVAPATLGAREFKVLVHERPHKNSKPPPDARPAASVFAFGEKGASIKLMWIRILICGVGVGLLAAGCQATRAGYESAPYQVVRSDGKFQVRDYPALTVVETPMAGSRSGEDGSFRRLFRFITGGNESKQKIAMTTPVFMSGSETNPTMAFVLPAKMKSGEVPKPADGSVTVGELAAGRFAVLRYSGGRNAEKDAESLAKLKSWMAAEQLGVMSPPVYGYFDPPWTPSFWRRNEVMLRTGGGK
jgi:DNA gyrase inhibitor GyrI